MSKVILQAIAQEVKTGKGKLEKMMAESQEWESSILKAKTTITLAKGEWHNFSSKFEL